MVLPPSLTKHFYLALHNRIEWGPNNPTSGRVPEKGNSLIVQLHGPANYFTNAYLTIKDDNIRNFVVVWRG